jgi:hypothetical protein
MNEELSRTDDGDSAVGAGTGLSTVSVRPFDMPPPGGGVTTVIMTDPDDVMKDAGIDAVSSVELKKFVVTGIPSQ